MKELTIEEKAKRYDELKVTAQGLEHDGCFDKITLFDLFPELEESEEEKIRKELIQFFSDKDEEDYEGMHPRAQIVAWLEKQGVPAALSKDEQTKLAKGVLRSCAFSFINYLDSHSYEGKMNVSNGECEDIENAFQNAMWDRLHRYYCKYIEEQGEQNHTDKVTPKFKVGDFIVNDYCMGKVIELTSDAYLLDTGQGIPFSYEHNAHLWTIQDAKDGDVLVHNGCTFIFMGIKDDIVQAIEENILEPVSFGEPDKDNDYHPATKEQREILFQKMKEAGYKWDADKKELKKIEPKTDWLQELQDKIDSLSKEDFEKVMTKYRRYGEEGSVDYDKLNTMLNESLSTETKESWNDRLGEEPVSEDLEKMSYHSAMDLINNPKFLPTTTFGELIPMLQKLYKDGAIWQKNHLLKPADGDDLPIFDREVIALLDNGKVVFAHRPPEYWDGKNIITGKVTRNYPKTYDKGGWNIPNVKYWLDCSIPKEIEL